MSLALAIALAAGPWDRVASIDVHFGTRAAPLGAVGVMAEITPRPWFGVAAGVGTLSGEGTRYGALGYLRTGGAVRVAVGTGLTYGSHSIDPNCELSSGSFIASYGCDAIFVYGSKQWPRAWSHVAEVALEGRTKPGFHYRLAVGHTFFLNRRDWNCTGAPCTSDSPFGSRLYFNLGFGWAFG